MLKKLDNRIDLKNIQLPFVPILPDLELKNISIRSDSEKWETLRFEVEIDNQMMRFKEFFLDWFYPSFPKSLLRTFSLPYAPLSMRSMKFQGTTYPVFFGIDYSGANAANAWMLGTTLEIRDLSHRGKDFIDRTMDIMLHAQPGALPQRRDFISRSFYAGKERKYSWFEEERIGRMAWANTKNDINGNFLNKFDRVCTGIFNGIHKLTVYSREDLNNEIWIDLFKGGSTLKNGVYRFDDDNNGILNTHSESNQFRIFSVSKFGPWLLRKSYNDIIATIGVSSGVEIGDIEKLIGDIEINRDKVINL